MQISFVRRACVSATAAAVAVGLAVSPTTAAVPEPHVGAATTWAMGQLQGGVFATNPVGIGTTLDLGLSLAAVGAPATDIATVRAGVDAHLPTYIGTTGNEGRVAKSAAFYAAIGADLRTAGGSDLLSRLETAVDDASGRLGSSSDVYGQVWAVAALHEVGSREAPAATKFLVGQRCAGAGWGFVDTSSGTSPQCVSEVDATAWAVLSLLPQRATDPTVAAAIADGLRWLETQRRADAGFGDWGVNDAGTTSSANSSGLVAWALGAAGDVGAAKSAARWVASHQIANGAIAFDDAARRAGYDSGTAGSWQSATSQALPALAFLGVPDQNVTLQTTAAKRTTKGKVRLKLTAGPIPTGFSAGSVPLLGEVKLQVRNRTLNATLVDGTATFAARKVFRGGKKKVRARLVYVGSELVDPFAKRVVLKAKRKR